MCRVPNTSGRVLQERAIHVAPRSRFLDELEDHMTVEAAEQTLRAAAARARLRKPLLMTTNRNLLVLKIQRDAIVLIGVSISNWIILSASCDPSAIRLLNGEN
jgi:hypothetical protein